jgi:hypothetical protein
MCFRANPTVEILARSAWEAISPSLPGGVALVERIVLQETQTCAAAISC